MLSTIQGRMLVIFAAFALLLGGVVMTTRSVLKQQSDDGLLVNLAGRQRMLTQKLTKESLQLVNAQLAGRNAKANEYRDSMRATMQVFETTLLSLRDGGPAPVNLDMTRVRQLPAAATPEIRAALDGVFSKWVTFKKHISALLASDEVKDAEIDGIIQGNMPIVASMSAATDLMQADSERKVMELYTVQSVSLVLGLLLVAAGVWLARTTISRPILELADAAHAMSTGNLNVEFHGRGTREVRELSASFDRMRASMMAAMDVSGAGADDL